MQVACLQLAFMTLKSELFEICKALAAEVPGWQFDSSGQFVNRTLKHTDLIVDPGFHFHADVSCSLTPWAKIDNKQVGKLYKRFTGMHRWTLGINFALEDDAYSAHNANRVTSIYHKKIEGRQLGSGLHPWPASFIVKSQAENYLRRVLADGIVFLERHFNFSSEEQLLRSLPNTYRWGPLGMSNRGDPGSFLEEQDGLVLCLAALIQGDFSFVERYASDDFKTKFPKRNELTGIVAALSEFRKMYAETGSVFEQVQARAGEAVPNRLERNKDEDEA